MSIEHSDVAAYALGLLEEPDRRAFETHLRGCARCRAEFAELSGAAGALTDLRGTGLDGGDEPGDRRSA